MRLSPGKLPANILERVLRHQGTPDRRVLIGPHFGVDAAVIDLGSQCLVLKSDPVTFTADEVGWYAVHVNANDVAVMGARPEWFQPTIILPPRATRADLRRIVRDIDAACRELGVAVTGGHTEISPAVRQPIVAGDMQAVMPKSALVRPDGARPGDVLLATKAVAIEGTAILARRYPTIGRRILGSGGQRRAARLHHDPGISVVSEALVCARSGATAMHDPTEGGIAAALYELARAGGRGLDIDLDRIPIRSDTAMLCAHFGLRPLGLIASGTLLVTVPPTAARLLVRRLLRRKIAATAIGSVTSARRIVARRNGKRVRFEWSPRDELARLDFPADR